MMPVVVVDHYAVDLASLLKAAFSAPEALQPLQYRFVRDSHFMRRGVGRERVQHVVLAGDGKLDYTKVFAVVEKPVRNAAPSVVADLGRAPAPCAAPAVCLYNPVHRIFFAQAADSSILHTHDDFSLSLGI